MQNPFNSNPLTRNRVFPSATFVKSQQEARDLHVPDSSGTYEQNMAQVRDLHVPQSDFPGSRLGASSVEVTDNTPLAKDEWTKWRMIRSTSPHGDWGDAFGREEMAKQQEQDKFNREWQKQSVIGNAKISADLEKDEFRKRLLKDVEDGRIFTLTQLEEEPNN